MDEKPKQGTSFRENWIRYLPAIILSVLLSTLAAAGTWRFAAAPGEPFSAGWMFWYAVIFSIVFISAINVYLLYSIKQTLELESAQTALKKSNKQLEALAEAANRRARELTLLAELSDTLQAFETAEEAIEAIKIVAPKIFYDVSGAVYLVNALKDKAEIKAAWGEAYLEKIFQRDVCIALRRNSVHMFSKDRDDPRCGHIGEAPPTSHICVPMVAQNKAFGLLYLSSPKEIGDETYDVALAVAEHLAMALTNIKLRTALKEQAVTDSLTKLFNRRFMEELLEREIRRADRGKTDIGIILMDVDGFKKINDTYGHTAGDVVLETLGIFLRTNVRREDYACRYGGDEFLMVLPGSSKKNTLMRAEDIRERAENLNHIYEGLNIGPITLSGGIAAFPIDGIWENALIEAVDAALYAAKKSGRNKIAQAKVLSKKKPAGHKGTKK